jgi:hypothetical protein
MYRTYARVVRNRVFLRKDALEHRRFGKKPGFFGFEAYAEELMLSYILPFAFPA